MRIIFFFDDTRIRTSEGHQDYKRTVYVLEDHNTTCHSSSSGVSTSTIFLRNIFQFCYEYHFLFIYYILSPGVNQRKPGLKADTAVSRLYY